MDAKQLLNQANKDYRTWGWKNNPFTLQPDPRVLVDMETETRDLILSINNRTHSMIVGEMGTGKTTVLMWLKLALSGNYHCIYFSQPPRDIISSMERELRKQGAFGILDRLFKVKLTIDKVEKVGKPILLLIDEAHEMDETTANTLKILSDKQNVVLVMAGQKSLQVKLEKFKALADRFVTKVTLNPMEPNLIETLIRARISAVGGKSLDPLNATVISEVCARAGGNPREALRLCNMVINAVLAGEKLE